MSKQQLSIEEIARRLFKPRWADTKEYKQALDAMERLSDVDLDKLNRLAGRAIDEQAKAAEIAQDTIQELKATRCEICHYSLYACVCE